MHTNAKSCKDNKTMFKNQPNKMATSTQLYKNAMRHYFPYDDFLKKSNVKYNFMNIFFFQNCYASAERNG